MNCRLEECIRQIGQYCKDAKLDTIVIDIDMCNNQVYYSVEEDANLTDEGVMQI
jgi:hypothetical protein